MKSLKKKTIGLFMVVCLSLSVGHTVLPIDNTISVSAKTYNNATIKKVQKKLNKKGYKCGTADGVMGKRTRKAIRLYQKLKGIKRTGNINKKLLKSLHVKEVKKPSSKTSDVVSKTVYITETGSKYHTAGCRYLWNSKIAISLKEARKYYSPCSVCNP